MAVNLALSPCPWVDFFDENGAPLAGGLLFTYESGTSTKLATYGDAAATTLMLNPIILNSAGRAVFYVLPQAYKYVIAPAGDSDPPSSPILTVDPVGAATISSTTVDIQGRAGNDLTAGQIVYLSSGSGGLTAGSWYQAQANLAYSSTAAEMVGIVPANITSPNSGAIRIVGPLAGVLGGLTPGTAYYIDPTTPGAITSSPPPNARKIGVATASGTIVLAEKRDDNARRATSFSTLTGNVGAGEDILATYTSGPQGLYAAGMAYQGRFWGLMANNANVKTLKLRLIEGANNIILIDYALTASIVGMWRLEFLILRKSQVLVGTSADVLDGVVNGPISRGGVKGLYDQTINFDNAVEIRLTGESAGAATDDVQVQGGLIERVNFGPG